MKHARPDYDVRIQDNEFLIPDDEPVLLIRGQDVLAVPLIASYLDLYDGSDPAVVDQLQVHLDRMIEWQRTHPTKAADVPPMIDCPSCDGSGVHVEDHGQGMHESLGCPDCRATGKVVVYRGTSPS